MLDISQGSFLWEFNQKQNVSALGYSLSQLETI